MAQRVIGGKRAVYDFIAPQYSVDHLVVGAGVVVRPSIYLSALSRELTRAVTGIGRRRETVQGFRQR